MQYLNYKVEKEAIYKQVRKSSNDNPNVNGSLETEKKMTKVFSYTWEKPNDQINTLFTIMM